MPRVRLDQVVSILLICLMLLSYKSLRPQEQEEMAARGVLQPVYQLVPSLVPVRSAVDEPIITASSAAVIDLASATPLYTKHARDVYLPASTTKLMTALVVRQSLPLDQMVEIPTGLRTEGSALGFQAGQTFTVRNLLKAMLIQSANDAAEILAQQYPGGRQAFVAQMNREAEQLHLQQTIFENPTGFDGTHHQTTAYDLAILAKQVVQDPVLQEIVATRYEYITDTTRRQQYYLVNTHEMVGVDPSVTGIKTGTTEGAGQVLITQVERDGQKLIIVVMGSSDRYADTRTLINWSFGSYRWETTQDLVMKHAILESNK